MSAMSALPAFLSTFHNVVRNVWAHTIIACGHFRDRRRPARGSSTTRSRPAEQPLRRARPRFRVVCERYGLPYTSRTWAQVIKGVLRLAFPGGDERGPCAMLRGSDSEGNPR